MAQKIMVGMSGGVDSSVAAYLLLRQGYEVTGVTFKLWDDPTLESGCCSADDVRDAAFVCQQLGIPHYVINYKDLFRQEVVCAGGRRTPASTATAISNSAPFPVN